jgi:hypothetical protein
VVKNEKPKNTDAFPAAAFILNLTNFLPLKKQNKKENPSLVV